MDDLLKDNELAREILDLIRAANVAGYSKEKKQEYISKAMNEIDRLVIESTIYNTAFDAGVAKGIEHGLAPAAR